MKFINKYKKYICNRKLIPYIIVLTILLLSVGYSAFSSNLSIRDLYAEVRLEKDVRITGVSVVPETGTTFNPYAYGAEYQIDPGDGITRTFYVLEDGDNTSLIKGDTGTTGVGEVSLIMNENIGDKTGWGIAGSGAPTIALPYLKEQTTGWSNVEVNMPTYEQIYSVNNSTDLTATPWLNDLSYDGDGTPGCYWTEKFSINDPGGDIGYSVGQKLYASRSYCFVRPVITLKKSDLLGTVVIQNNGGTTTYLDYNTNNLQAGINLPNANSSVTFNAVVTNLGSAEVGIKSITGLPDNLDYEILNYNLKDKICDENNICKLGIQKEILIKIKYKEGYYDSDNTKYNIVANFNFEPFYSVTYTDIEGSGYPTEILGGDTLTVDFRDNAPNNIKVKMNNVETTNYTYENGILTLPNVSGNVEIFKPQPSFADDDWSTIIANVQAGNLSAYKVGDTKEIALTGFTNGEEGSNGLYTIRIANISTPSECATLGFSQTACGFVIEFEDIITTHNMNSSSSNVGGYPASSMYTYIQNDIYNALPKELKDVIIPTYVVSGHGSTSGEENFVTEQDKVYLLSGKEIYGSDTYDTSSNLTRQLEYYSNLGVTASNNSGALKKLNGSNASWWLRSANSNNSYHFRYVSYTGRLNNGIAGNSLGVAVAFRIG